MDPKKDTSKPLLAKAVEPSVAAVRADREPSARPARGDSLPAEADPEAVLDRIKSLITDHFLTARRLAVEAADRFPGHAGIQNAKRILNGGGSTVGSGGPEPSRREEFEWLRNPPESVRGKWVALVGSKLVGTADNLAELAEELRSRQFERTPLVHRIEPA